VPNVPAGLHMLYCSVDEMWYAVGDLSADFSFYTKRALLAGVVSTTTLYWLDDESDRRADSWAFLDRRLADVLKIPQLGRRAESLLLRLPNPFRLLQLARDRRRRPA